MRKETDFLVIGSGIAGLSFALRVAQYGRVLIITKSNEDESNTKYAQGGIAAVFNENDSIEKHVADTLDCGDGMCDTEVVELVVREGINRVNDIIKWGTEFDKSKEGTYDLAKEGGHSEHRVLHYKDLTGYQIETKLLQQIEKHPQIEILTHHFAIDLITQHHLGKLVKRSTENIECYGVYAYDIKNHTVDTILSKITLMASGGAGCVYQNTTNPIIATGDGIAMAYRAKAKIRDMEFIQFHPTALYNPGQVPAFLISEAVRGFGAILKTASGKEFMHDYDERGSLAPRDIVARAIDNELKKSGEEFVHLDCRHLKKDEFVKHFPTIHQKCLSIGIDPFEQCIPVVPAAHYVCGGIVTNKHAETSIRNLFASGECASTGLHGANRLASNSLLEALVFSHRASIFAIESVKNIKFKNNIPDWDASGTRQAEEMVLITFAKLELQSLMSNYVGIVRSDIRLQRAFDRLKILYDEHEQLYHRTIVSVQLCELRNLINVAYLIVKNAMERKTNKGLHYSIDN
ncbi:MAG TPA: L-aspartate oxidase [Bacteroidia bacterium]|nr:L-aspartate oxidase [Bacteroidia bacterium]HNT79434.1 L-aspartate oxidase [Bacteroidia bacterium]